MIELIELEKKEAPAGRRGQGVDNSVSGAAICLDCTRFSMPFQISINWDLISAELEIKKIVENFQREEARIMAAWGGEL